MNLWLATTTPSHPSPTYLVPHHCMIIISPSCSTKGIARLLTPCQSAHPRLTSIDETFGFALITAVLIHVDASRAGEVYHC